MARYKLYTGPTLVKQVADKLRSAHGYGDILEGTEHVYFTSTAYGTGLNREGAFAQLKLDGVTGFLFSDLQPTRN